MKRVQGLIGIAIASLVSASAFCQVSVLTQDYDITRSAANLSESTLSPANVSSATFGKRFAYPVDEEVFAQPLYIPQLTIGGVAHNVVFVATMGNSVYAFDADNAASAGTPLWHVNLASSVPQSKFLFFAGGGFSRDGIYSTPVIDSTSKTMYLVSHEWSVANQSVKLQLHALDLTSGAEKFGGPVQLNATGFDANVNEQRAGLLLMNGTVYVAVASHADFHTNLTNLTKVPYVGMVLAYDSQTLAQLASFNAEKNGTGGAIWQGGRGLASDGTYIYAMTANAITLGSPDYSESFVQLNPTTLSVVSFYQDKNATCMNTLDLDLASAGPVIIPGAGTNLLVGGGKQGKVYELKLDLALNSQTPLTFWGTTNHALLPADGGTCADPRPGATGWLQANDSAFWSNPAGTSYFYTFGNNDNLMSWSVSGTTFTQTSLDSPTNLSLNSIAVSANGGTGGILWTVANQTTGIATVSAYDAVPAGGHLKLLWSSKQVPKRDAFGQLGRYSTPTVANGKVYLASGSNQVVVYGPLPAAASIQVSPALGSLAFTALNTRSEAVNVNAVGTYTGTVNLSLIGLPAGMTYTLIPSQVTLTATAKSVATKLSISPANATLPLEDDYTVQVVATGTGGVSTQAPIRLATRNASFSNVAKVACNSQLQMSADMTFKMNGSSIPSLWIQDPTTPSFPGRLWMEPGVTSGTETTGYWIDNKKGYLYWLIDQSAGAPANLDNALAYTNLGLLYKCP